MSKTMSAVDQQMLAYFRRRLIEGSTTPLEDTESEFGEDATWCIAASAKSCAAAYT